jgi:hypothetical protein
VFSEKSGQAELRIFNSSGELILTELIFEDKIIDVSDFTAGVYMVIVNGNGKSVSQKLVIISNLFRNKRLISLFLNGKILFHFQRRTIVSL